MVIRAIRVPRRLKRKAIMAIEFSNGEKLQLALAAVVAVQRNPSLANQARAAISLAAINKPWIINLPNRPPGVRKIDDADAIMRITSRATAECVPLDRACRDDIAVHGFTGISPGAAQKRLYKKCRERLNRIKDLAR